MISKKNDRKEERKAFEIPAVEFASDSFVCDKDPNHRMYLKIYGDTTPCKIRGSSGTMHRVY